MPHLVAAPDKFRGTATATEVAAAIGRAARDLGWSADEVPMSDGGEGLLEATGGEPQFSLVAGPLGEPVEAEWRLLHVEGAQTAVIEMSRAAGRALVPSPHGDEPMRADTTGVGQLLLAAAEAGATRIVVGAGGSATTDGGWGAVRAVGSAERLEGIDVVVATDVTTAFVDAAAVFGPQKGATPAQVDALSDRLGALVETYRTDFGVDVSTLSGAGAAGGLAGGLAVLGGRITPGFGLVASLTGLGERVGRADLVVTGEGHLDPPSFEGKVPGGVLDLVAGRCRVLCVVGAADPGLVTQPPAGMQILSLTERFGSTRSRQQTIDLIVEVMDEELPRFCP